MDATGHSALALLYFRWETSLHPICITVIQCLKTIFANIWCVCFAVLIKFHFKFLLFLFSQQFQMGVEIFLKYCAADVVTQEWVKQGQENKSRELWRVNCFPGFSVYLLCCVMQVAYPLCPSTASCWKDMFPVDFPASHYLLLEESTVKLMKNATEGCKVLLVFQGLIRRPLKEEKRHL